MDGSINNIACRLTAHMVGQKTKPPSFHYNCIKYIYHGIVHEVQKSAKKLNKLNNKIIVRFSKFIH